MTSKESKVVQKWSRLGFVVLLYRVASHGYWEGLKLFWGRVSPSSQEKSPPIDFSKLFLFQIIIESGVGINTLSPLKSHKWPLGGVAASIIIRNGLLK